MADTGEVVKRCARCGQSKFICEFYAHRAALDGYMGKCKECVKLDVRQNYARVGMLYDFSEKGVIRVIYKTQKRHQKIRGHGAMPYSKLELSAWLYSNGFISAFDAWVNSGHKKDLKPSVDRLNDMKGYSFENIRLVTWLDNRRAQYLDIRNGTGTGGARCKPVLRVNSLTGALTEYISYSSAVKDIGYSIEYQLKNRVTCRNGFFWTYKDQSQREAA